MTHTPGPWTINITQGEMLQHSSNGAVVKVIADRPYGGLIADVSAWWVDTESCKANAVLIAAAPELLEACKKVSAISAELTGTGREATLGLRLYEAVKDAIKKAETKITQKD